MYGSVTSLEERLVVGRGNGSLGSIVVVLKGAEGLGSVGGGGWFSRAATKGTAITWSGDRRANESSSSSEESTCELHFGFCGLECR